MTKHIIFFLFCLASFGCSSGKTIEYFDADWHLSNKKEAAYYRFIHYHENGYPKEDVKGYYISGELQFEGRLLSANPDTLDGLCVWYHKSGQKSQEAFFENGEVTGIVRNWNEKGKAEGILDESGRFFSSAYRNEKLKEVNEVFQRELLPDSIALAFLLNKGMTLLNEKDVIYSYMLFQLAHDLSVLLKDTINLARSCNSIGDYYHNQVYFEEALEWYNKSIDIQEHSAVKMDLATSYRNKGGVYELQGRPLEALVWYYEAAEVSKQIGAEAELASAYHEIGFLYRSQGQLEEALHWYYKAKTIQEKLDLEEDLAISYNNIGGAYTARGQMTEALKWFNKAMMIQQKSGLEGTLARTYDNIGFVKRSQGQIKEAMEWYQKAIEIREKKKDEVELARSYFSIGGIYASMSQLEEALHWYYKARDSQKQLEMKEELSMTYTNIGGVYDSKGQLDTALFWYFEAIDIQQLLGLEEDLAITYNNVAYTYQTQGNLDEAIKWYQKTKEIQEDLDLKADLAKTYNNIGGFFDLNNEPVNALIYYRKASDIQLHLGLEIDLATSYINIGYVYQSIGQLEKALDKYHEARQIQERLNLQLGVASSYNNIGAVYNSQGQMSKALEWYNKAKEIRERLDMKVDLAVSYNNIALLYFNYVQLDSAYHYAQKNIQINESLRNLNQGEANRQMYFNKNLDAVEIGVTSGFQLHKKEEAYEISEKGKARTFVDLLTERSVGTTKIPQSLSVKFQSVKDHLSILNQTLSQSITQAHRKQLLIKRDSVYRQKLLLEDRIKVVAPEYANLFYSPIADVNRVQAALKKDELLISYFTGRRKTFAFIITPDKIEMIDLGPSDNIQLLVNAFRNDFLLEQRKAIEKDSKLDTKKLEKQFFKYSHKLYEKLWKPLENKVSLEERKIILTLDGFLNYLPFELLIKDSKQEEYSKYHYLVRDYEINYYPSGTLFYLERSNKKAINRNWKKSFFGIALSDFENNHCYEDQLTFSKLDFSEAEIMSIANQFSHERVTTLINETATEDSLKKSVLSDYRYLHFSTHGVINSTQADFNRILLGHIEEDGCLNVYEIFEQKWEVDLVTLSACETGLGKLVRGEGMVGFTRALMYAGTPSVILSLWEVGDESTKNLFVDYYTRLSQSRKDKYSPFYATQLHMIENGGEYSNPYYWAPFVFIGERYSQN